MKQQLIDIYLDWLNNFLTVEKFAAYYDLTVEQATKLIELAREITVHED